jgi:hypothetical protein
MGPFCALVLAQMMDIEDRVKELERRVKFLEKLLEEHGMDSFRGLMKKEKKVKAHSEPVYGENS